MNDQRLVFAADAVMRGNGQRALDHLAEVQNLDDPTVWLVRAKALGLLDQHPLAEDACRRGIALDPTHVALRIELARAFEAQSLYPHAESALLSVLNENPENFEALVAYAWLLARSGDVAGARKVMERFPPQAVDQLPSLMARQGYIALVEGRRNDAREFIGRGMQMAPEATGIRMLRATEAAMHGNTGAAASYLTDAARLDPAAAGEQGRYARYLNHPVMAPTRLVNRIGPAQMWIGWLVVLFGLPRVWPSAPMGWIVIGYLCFAAWTWVAPTLLRRWMIRKGQL